MSTKSSEVAVLSSLTAATESAAPSATAGSSAASTAASEPQTLNPSEASGVAEAVISTQTQPQPPSTSNLVPMTAALVRLMGAYMDDFDLEEFSKTALFSPGACQGDVDARRKLREERAKKLLPYVFGGNPDFLKAQSLKDLFGEAGINLSNLLLTKTSFRERSEGYSKTLREYILREWQAVSPLEAATCSGDEFFLLDMLAPLIEDEIHRREARLQLEAIERRIKDHAIVFNAVEAIRKHNEKPNKETEAQLNSILESEDFKRCMATDTIEEQLGFPNSFGPNHEAGDSKGDHKTQQEAKAQSERAYSNYADTETFLAPVLRLIKAYINYIIQYPKLVKDQKNHDKLKFLWGLVGEAFIRLPHYFKQEYFDDKPFDPIPTFSTPPKRGPLHDYFGEPLNLDELGLSNCLSVYKGCPRGGLVFEASGWLAWSVASVDLSAVTHLFKLRPVGLRNIIEKLKTLETSRELVASRKHVSSKP